MQFDLFDQGSDSQTGSRQTDLEMLIAEKAPMNTYELKQEAKRDRLNEAADRADEKAEASYKRSDMSEGASGIPFGQPILVGHHSEGRHRAAIKRADNAMRASVEDSKRAKELRSRADSVGKGGVSSDDPAATRKLQDQIDAAQGLQDFMKGANKLVKKAIKAGVENEASEGFEAYRAEVSALKGGDVRADQAAGLLKPDFGNRVGFAAYQISNNNANIKRMQKRVDELRKAASREHVEVEKEGFTVVQNVEENRLQFVFPGKPSAEVRAIMKSNGFRWAPSQDAWQRQLTNNAIYSGKFAMKEIAALG
jgi:hypothetical protein